MNRNIAKIKITQTAPGTRLKRGCYYALLFIVFFGVNMVYADWTMELMNGQNDRKEIKLELPLKRIWMKKYPQTSCPVIMDNKLYILDDEPKYFLWGNRRLIAWEIDKKTGEKKEKHVIGEVKNITYRQMMGYQGRIYIAAVWLDDSDWKNEILYFWIYAYDTIKKETIWSFNQNKKESIVSERIGAWLNADDGKILLTLMTVYDNNKLFCFDAKKGNILWKTNKPENVGVDNTCPAIGDGKVYLGTAANQAGGKITAFDINTGAVIWEKSFIEKKQVWKLNRKNLLFLMKDDYIFLFIRGQIKGFLWHWTAPMEKKYGGLKTMIRKVHFRFMSH